MSENLDEMVEALDNRLENPEFISSEDRAFELIAEALEYLGEAYDFLEVDFEDEDPAMKALAAGMENIDNAKSYFGVDDEQEN